MSIRLTKLEKRVLDYIANSNGGKRVWYWSGADHFEPANYEKEQEKYGQTRYDSAIDGLDYKGLIKYVQVKGTANGEYLKVTKKGKKLLEKKRLRE